MSEVQRESWSVHCAAAACRYARLMLAEDKAHELAREHASSGHKVDVFLERIRRVARYGPEICPW